VREREIERDPCSMKSCNMMCVCTDPPSPGDRRADRTLNQPEFGSFTPSHEGVSHYRRRIEFVPTRFVRSHCERGGASGAAVLPVPGAPCRRRLGSSCRQRCSRNVAAQRRQHGRQRTNCTKRAASRVSYATFPPVAGVRLHARARGANCGCSGSLRVCD
jgi:hypothetical protein